MSAWTQSNAIDLCRKLEEIAPQFGAHIGLTGGCLYKDGDRKDCDIIVYRVRQVESIDTEGFFEAIGKKLGIHFVSGFGWCRKAKFGDLKIDFFFPDEDGEYTPDEGPEFVGMEEL